MLHNWHKILWYVNEQTYHNIQALLNNPKYLTIEIEQLSKIKQ